MTSTSTMFVQKSLILSNDRIRLTIRPDLGGRIDQVSIPFDLEVACQNGTTAQLQPWATQHRTLTLLLTCHHNPKK